MARIRFVLRTDKVSKRTDGTQYFFPLELVYQKDGDRAYLRISETLPLICWDKKQQAAIAVDKKSAKRLQPEIPFDLLPSARKVDGINAELVRLRQAVSKIEQRYGAGLDVEDFTAKEVVESLKPAEKVNKKSQFLYDYIDKYIEDHKEKRVAGSLSVYKALKSHLKAYQETKKPVSFDAIDLQFFESFQSFLSKPRRALVHRKNPALPPVYRDINLSSSTIAKQLSTIKTFLNHASLHGVKVNDGYKKFRIKKEQLEVIALTEQEFEALFYLDLSANETLSRVRDVFCFACTTGLRYSDLAQLKREHIKGDEIRLTVIKTKQPLTIPLNPYSFRILEKYKDKARPIPVISNQKTNEHLKKLCKQAGITDAVQIVRHQGGKRSEPTYHKYELVGVHTGRKTFATLSLEKGMSAEEVMKIGGWKSYSSFARYVNITDKRTKHVMNKAWGSIDKPILKAV